MENVKLFAKYREPCSSLRGNGETGNSWTVGKVGHFGGSRARQGAFRILFRGRGQGLLSGKRYVGLSWWVEVTLS